STPGYVAIAAALVLAAGGVALNLRSPFAVLGVSHYLKPRSDRLLEGVSRSRLERLDRAIVAYVLSNGAPPSTLEEGASSGLVDRTYLHHPRAGASHHDITGTGYLLSATDEKGKTVAGSMIERTIPRGK